MEEQKNEDQCTCKHVGNGDSIGGGESVFEGDGECRNPIGIIPSKCNLHKTVPRISPATAVTPFLQRSGVSNSDFLGSSNHINANPSEYLIDPWEVAELQARVQRLTDECLDLKQKLSSSQEEGYSFQLESDELKKKLSQGAKFWQDKVKQLEEDLEDAKITALSTEDLNEVLKMQIRKLEKSNGDLEGKTTSLEKELGTLASDLEYAQERLKSKEEEVEVISRHSEEYIENWLTKEKFSLEDKIRQLEGSIDSLTQTNNRLLKAQQLEDNETCSEILELESVTNPLNTCCTAAVKEITPPLNNSVPTSRSSFLNDSSESLHSEISVSFENQPQVLTPIFGGFGRCEASTQSDLYPPNLSTMQTQTDSDSAADLCTPENIVLIVDSVYCQTDVYEGDAASCQTEFVVGDSVSCQTEVTEEILLCDTTTELNKTFRDLSSYDFNSVQTDCNQNIISSSESPILCTRCTGEEQQSVSKLKSFSVRHLLYFEIGLLVLVLFVGVILMLSVLIPFWKTNGELFLGLMEFPHNALKYGRLDHIQRPII